jgi:hypothetical protein
MQLLEMGSFPKSSSNSNSHSEANSMLENRDPANLHQMSEDGDVHQMFGHKDSAELAERLSFLQSEQRRNDNHSESSSEAIDKGAESDEITRPFGLKDYRDRRTAAYQNLEKNQHETGYTSAVFTLPAQQGLPGMIL